MIMKQLDKYVKQDKLQELHELYTKINLKLITDLTTKAKNKNFLQNLYENNFMTLEQAKTSLGRY